MKKFLLLLLLILSIHLSAQFATPGNNGLYSLDDLVAISNGAISLGAEQYYFNEEIIISATDTLRINNDVAIEIGEGLLWIIEGVLQIDPSNLVNIRNKNLESNFKGIRFDNSSASYVHKTAISYAGGIKVVNTDMDFIDCNFSSFDTEYSTGAIDLFQSDPLIRACNFSNNEGPAIASGANSSSSPRIINNTMIGNVSGNGNTPQINLGTSNGFVPIVIDSNKVNGQYDNAGGIALSTLAAGNINAFVRYNEITNNRYGIAVIGDNISGEIAHNYIAGNNIQNNPMLGGSGLNFNGGNTNNITVHHNLILNNLWGITIQNSANPNLGDGLVSSPGHNQIYDNGNSGEIYALYNNTPDNILAHNNFWGTASLEETEDVIFHQTDDPGLGEVFYDPIWTPVGLNEIPLKELSFYPNPASKYFIWDTEGANIKIVSLQGKVIWKGWVERASKVAVNWEAGVYFVHSNGRFEKLIVQ
jgi:hypothetical protein